MTIKQTILFFLAIIVLIISEYYLFHELYNDKRWFVVMVSLISLIISAFFIFRLFKSYISKLKEH